MRSHAFFLCFATMLEAADLIPASAPKTESFRLDGYFEPGAGASIASSRISNLAVLPNGLRFGRYGSTMNFKGDTATPSFRWGQAIAGDIREFPGNQIKHRYRGIELLGVYPNLDMEFLFDDQNRLIWRLKCQTGCDWRQVHFEVPQAYSLFWVAPNFEIRLSDSRLVPELLFKMISGGAIRVEDSHTFGIDASPGATVEILIPQILPIFQIGPAQLTDREGNSFVSFPLPDDFGTPDPFPAYPYRGCLLSTEVPIPCRDIAIAKFSKMGDLQYITQLRGGQSEELSTLVQATDGKLLIAGVTNSSDFPTLPGAYQTTFGGPTLAVRERTLNGDLWLAKLDPDTGTLFASTYLGGPEGEVSARIEAASDGSIFIRPTLFLPGARRSGGSPTTAGSLGQNCGDPCLQDWVARMNPSLTALIYGTYLPVGVTEAMPYSDNSLYFVGYGGPGFPVTTGAYQSTVQGAIDVFVGRLDPSGRRLQFGTYYGGTDNELTTSFAVASDASVWLAVSEAQSRVGKFVHVSSDGTRVINQFATGTYDLAIDQNGILHTILNTSTGNGDCGLRYLRFNDRGEKLTDMAIRQDARISAIFTGQQEDGVPIVNVSGSLYKFDSNAVRGPFIACALSAGRFQFISYLAPGTFITLFGEQLAPNATKVFINGWDAPVVYSSEKQVNLLVPFELTPGEPADLEVESAGKKSQLFRMSSVARTQLDLFQVVQNEDGSINSQQNPAGKGSIVVLWATGAGQTNPASYSGEITPLTGRPLIGTFNVNSPGGIQHAVLYGAAAPGAYAGLIQINVRLNPAAQTGAVELRVALSSAGTSSTATVPVYLR